jgi:hypothetical protein
MYALKNKPSKIENRKNSDRHVTATAEKCKKSEAGAGRAVQFLIKLNGIVIF